MPAARADLYIERGAVFDELIEWDTSINPTVLKDLTNYTAKAHIRQSADGPLLLERKTADGTIVLGGVAGTIRLKMTDVVTAALPLLKGAGRWDLYLFDAALVPIRFLEGWVWVSKAVTHG